MAQITVKGLEALARRAREGGRAMMAKDAARGLIFRAAPSGYISAQYRYVLGGKERRHTLGPVAVGSSPGHTLAEIREAHSSAARRVKDGHDVADEQHATREANRAALRVNDLIDEFARVYLAAKKGGAETERLLRKDLAPSLGKVPAAKVTRRDVVLLVEAVRERAPVTANRLLGAIVKMFNFGLDRGAIEAHNLHGITRPEERPRQRALNDAEIGALLRHVDSADLSTQIARALRTVLATCARPGEVSGMLREEVKGNEWHLPAERSKNGEGRTIPLSPFALAAMAPALALAEKIGSPFVFTGVPSTNADGTLVHRPIDRHSLSRAMLRKCRIPTADDVAKGVPLIPIEPATPHDLRRSGATAMQRLGIEPWIIELCLGHRLVGTGTVSTYVIGRFDKQVRDALASLGAHLDRLEHEA